ncbi:hypothetical protein DWB61_09685 [Ancylomarina euxinus]|uniref:histidine kinase n=1 Tax=Ancylomarina euxinus TaxID=2283627 RepID=A0A425Y0W4_9BACT|nr:cache domain-containing protein [Ancylomarina euxinus]MCZ4693802.1 cache domain-containing protein [Ancylomarina euxinus]MUP15119.1 hypothetical protein [Ancylomarina euxinus]RRG21542.1 hypothetical protein DWB61_09685 [Ancylomarina euxinus]
MKSRLIDIPRLFRNYNILILLLLSIGFGSLVIIIDYQNHEKDVIRSREAIENEKKQFLKHSVDNAISYINYNNSKVEEKLDEELSLNIQNAWKLATGIYNKFKDTRSEQEIKTLIKAALRPLRYFNDRGYIYIINMDGYTQMHPVSPEKEGHLLTDIQDISGKYVIQDEIKLMREKKEGFINYLWTKPNSTDDVSHMKRAFLKRFEPYNWFFGLGEYQDDFKEDLKQETLKWFRQSYDPSKWHLFINDYDGKALIINSDKYKAGVNIKTISDDKGIKIFKEELNIAKNTEGDFLRYSWLDATTGKYTPRVTYIKGYNQWQWMIGASSSTVTIDKAIAQKEKDLLRNSLQRITYLLLAMLGASALFFIISQFINNRIRNNFNSFISEFESAISKQQLLQEDKFNLTELRRLSKSINKLLKNHLKNLDDLKLSEQKFRIVVENAPVYILGFNPKGLVKLWNKQCEDFFKYSSGKILNTPLPFEEIYYSDSIETIKEFINSPSEEYRLSHVKLKNGQESYKYWASFELNKDLRIWVGHDVTALKLTEQKMRALNATKDKFFSIIAHDLRNPFNALITLSSYLIEAIESSNKAEAIELAKIIETSSEQGFELLVNLLEWSRTQTGSIQYNPELINLKKELKNPIQIVEGIAESKDIILTHNINEDITVLADPNMIRTVVRNLLSNAVKFTPKNGRISFEAFDNDDEVLIKICDNGVGMSQDIIDNLFSIEVNTSSTGTAGETGTGLGLILCFEFVKKHNGNIWVESEIGKGSCFSFSIPKRTINT